MNYFKPYLGTVVALFTTVNVAAAEDKRLVLFNSPPEVNQLIHDMAAQGGINVTFGYSAMDADILVYVIGTAREFNFLPIFFADADQNRILSQTVTINNARVNITNESGKVVDSATFPLIVGVRDKAGEASDETFNCALSKFVVASIMADSKIDAISEHMAPLEC